ncbi:MAG: RNA-binding S4 domain-containing protein [bacterium]|jgi:ribosomal 50S subunit-recycling heat shock protein
MRLDKFLKVSRLVKRRTLAKEVSDQGRILINGRVAKPASEVEPGDVLELHWGGKKVTVEVLEVRPNVRAGEAKDLYRVVKEEVFGYQES